MISPGHKRAIKEKKLPIPVIIHWWDQRIWIRLPVHPCHHTPFKCLAVMLVVSLFHPYSAASSFFWCSWSLVVNVSLGWYKGWAVGWLDMSRWIGGCLQYWISNKLAGSKWWFIFGKYKPSFGPFFKLFVISGGVRRVREEKKNTKKTYKLPKRHI